MEDSTPEWNRYSCDIPERDIDSSSRACIELSEVHHVVHVPEARRILEDGRIKASLVHDESRLDRSRLPVAWLSANTWAYGSIYGSVQFTFDWDRIIEGRKVYWVEAMDYRPPAYRLLLSERGPTDSSLVQTYDPENDDGPLKHKNGTWYWNGNYTSEFMVEADLPLGQCQEIEFIRHNDRCRRGSSCPEKGDTGQKSSRRVLAFILGNAVHTADGALWPAESDNSWKVNYCINEIWRALGSKPEWFTGGIKKPASRQAVLRGALALYGSDQQEAARDLIALLASQETFGEALRDIVAMHFDRSDYKLLL